MESFEIDERLDPKVLERLTRELKDREDALGFLKSDLVQSDETLRAGFEVAIARRDEQIKTIIETDGFKQTLRTVIEQLESEAESELAEYTTMQNKLMAMLPDEDKALFAPKIEQKLQELRKERVLAGIAGRALHAVGIDAASIAEFIAPIVEPEPEQVPEPIIEKELVFAEDIEEQDDSAESFEPMQVTLKISRSAVRINDGQIVKFASFVGSIDYSQARRRALERLAFCKEGDQLSFPQLISAIAEFNAVDPEALIGKNFINVRTWLEKIIVDGNPVFIHNHKRAGASRYGINPLFNIIIQSEYELSAPPTVGETTEPLTPENELDTLITSQHAAVIHGAMGHLHRSGKLGPEFPEYPFDGIDQIVDFEMNANSLKLEILGEQGLRTLRNEAFDEIVKLIESDDLLRVIDLINEEDSRYLLVDFLSQLTTEQQELLKNLFRAQLVTDTNHEKVGPYTGRLEIHSHDTHLVGDNGELYHSQTTNFTGAPLRASIRVDLTPAYLRAAQEEAADEALAAAAVQASAIGEQFIVTETDAAEELVEVASSTVLPETEPADDIVAAEIVAEPKVNSKIVRTKSQERFFEAGVAYLDSQVISKIRENNLTEGMSRHALQQFFSFMQVRKFMSAKENGQVRSVKEDGITFDDLFILALCGNRRLKSKMDVNSFKDVIDDLRTYFFEAIVQE